MKLKAVRASLAAVLTATLLISLFPLAYAGSAASWNQQGAAPSKARRGKNGEPATKSPDNPDTSTGLSSVTEPSPDASKPAPPTQPNQQPPVIDREQTAQTADSPPVKAEAKRDTATSWPTGARSDAASSQPQHDAPPFDRPPLRAGGRPSNDSSVRSSDSSPQTRRPTYSGGDRSSGGDPRGPASRPSQGSTSTRTSSDGSYDPGAGSNNDPERDRSTGPAPVLRRPADSRSRDEVATPRPPVLRRPSDPQPGDARTSDRTAAPPSGSGQQQAESADDVVKLESTLVNLPLLVSDRSGRYIPQLSARDFSLHEDGVQQTIASFGSEEVPFSVVLLLDVSPSVQGNVEDIQDAAIAFVRQLRNHDRVMVASFDRQIHYLSDFTSDRRELEWAIRKVNTGSGTSVYDAVFEVVQRKLRNVEGRKALILFSDGEDTTSSRASYDDAVNVVTESDVLVYGLRYPGSGGRGGGRVDPWPRSPIPGIQLPFPFPWPFPRRRRGPFRLTDPIASGNNAMPSSSPQSWPRRNRGGGDFMADLTTAGGGPVYDAEKISDLSRLANRIAEELRHVYVISYYPTNPLSNGGYRSVRVSFKGRDDLAVRHRRGYNARPSGTAKPTI
jgi:Ca-activated chloride channel homolog